ncbi:MAG: alpha/beta hydrolase, partial [Sphingomonas sp.]|nr:alpha/beta hydrolase [Sphingomonas sp.]
MHFHRRILAALAAGAALVQGGCAGRASEPVEVAVAPAAPELMKWPDLLTRPKPAPTATVAYGADPLQVADLWLPRGRGPHPTVLMVHGGCWQTKIADRTIMNWIADDLRARGIAVWNVDYRGVDLPGGGYPGTYLDSAAATDALRTHAARYNLDLSRLAAVGHSAGGHLALWLAGRGRLPRSG